MLYVFFWKISISNSIIFERYEKKQKLAKIVFPLFGHYWRKYFVRAPGVFSS